MAESIIFNKRQRFLVKESLEIAETLAETFFKVDLADFQQFPFDIQTLANLHGAEKTRRALAQVCKYEYKKTGSPWKVGTKEFYRICLQDDKILRRAQKENQELLKPLLLYVVTHELIHVIRFSLDPGKFHLHPQEKGIEERNVHRMTYELLTPFRDPGVELLLNHYRRWWAKEENYFATVSSP